MRTRLTAAFLALAVTPVLAQQQTQQQQPATGLDSLEETRVLTELAGRNLQTLLDHAMSGMDIPPAQKQALLTRIALQRLSPENIVNLSNGQRIELVRQANEGIADILPQLNDPVLIMQQAAPLIGPGIQRDVDLLRYWGRNEQLQSRLKPTIDTILALYARAHELTEKKIPDLERAIDQDSPGALDRYGDAVTMLQTAEYTSAIAQYYKTLALDAADPQRAAIAKEAIDYLQQFDVDGNPQRAFVQNMIGNLRRAEGKPAEALEKYNAVIAATDSPINESFDAHFSRVLAQLDARDVSAARKAFEEMNTWSSQAFASNPDAAKGLIEILRYRLLAGEAKLAENDADRKAADTKANDVLLALVNDRPDLREVIFEQLVSRLDENPDFTQIDPLLLQALVDQGRGQAIKKEGADEQVLRKAIGAAQELTSRKGVEARLQAEAAFLLPFYQQKLGDKLAAAQSYVDYIANHRDNMQRAQVALTNAQVLIGELRQQNDADPQVRELFDRLLSIAVFEPFNNTDLAFMYAYRQQQLGNAAEALRGFALVPAGDPNYAAAQYFTLVALKDRLEAMKEDDPELGGLLTQIDQLSSKVLGSTRQAMNAASGNARAPLQSRLARVTLLLADLARRVEQQPEKAIKLLENFEQTVSGLPGAEDLIGQAISIRFQSLASAGRSVEAKDELLKLLKSSEGSQGIEYVVRFLRQLNREFDEALQNDDEQTARDLAASRAQLTPELVKWSQENSDPAIRQLEYRYRVFDADSQRIAANLASEGPDRDRLLTAALQRYKDLESQANFDSYRASLPPAEAEKANYDPQVVLGVGRIAFATGDYKESLARFQRLLQDRVMGDPVRVESQDGQTVETDNDLYWEVVYKFIRSNVELGSGVDQMTSYLKREYIKWGDRVGGELWAKEFTELKAKLAPDFDWRAVRGDTGP